MSIGSYLEAVKTRLLTDAIVDSFQIVRERATLSDGHLRVRVTLSNGSRFEFSEYVQFSASGAIKVVTYSYHWADAQNNLIRRWDNTPHHPTLSGFPHHIHDGATGSAVPSSPTNIFAVLDEISRHL